jgi:hypothetical protein
MDDDEQTKNDAATGGVPPLMLSKWYDGGGGWHIDSTLPDGEKVLVADNVVGSDLASLFESSVDLLRVSVQARAFLLRQGYDHRHCDAHGYTILRQLDAAITAAQSGGDIS